MAKRAFTKSDLWVCVSNYSFEDIVPTHMWDQIKQAFGGTNASLVAFADKLARKAGWSTEFALLAIEEYKKFVFLAIVSDHQVTPPKAIDEVWHQHLLFTRGYRMFCNEVIEYELDHNPELVPNEGQTGVYHAQYHYTLEQHRKEFGTEPPQDIWGRPKFRPESAPWGYQPKRKTRTHSNWDFESDDVPLHTSLDERGPEASNFDGFHGGHSGGAGVSGGWGAIAHQCVATHESYGADAHSCAADAGGGDSGCGSCGGCSD